MLTWILCKIVVRLFRLGVTGQRSLPAGSGPVVIACNHRSWVDPVAIVAALGGRRRVVFLAAREHIERRRLLNWMLSRLGVVIKVDRSSSRQRDVLRAAEAALRGGASLALFPEGRINVVQETRQELLPFEPGV